MKISECLFALEYDTTPSALVIKTQNAILQRFRDRLRLLKDNKDTSLRVNREIDLSANLKRPQ